MGKAGRKRKAGPREPNGRPQRSTVERLNDLAAGERRKMQATVLMQPHRGGRVASTSLVKDVLREVGSDGKIVETAIDTKRTAVFGTDKPYAESPLGRFCFRLQLSPEHHDAGRRFAVGIERWQASRGIPVTRNRTPGSPPPEPVTEEEKKRAKERRENIRISMVKAERVLLQQGAEALFAVRQLAVDEYDLSHEQDAHAIMGLSALAYHYGLFGKNLPPLR